MPQGQLESGPGPLGSRLLWFAGLWLASVAALGVVAFVLRWVLL